MEEVIALEDLIEDAAITKAEIKRLEKELKAKQELIEAALDFGDKKTATAFSSNFKVTAQLKETISWDQTKLKALRKNVGDGEFLRLFNYEFKPIISVPKLEEMSSRLPFGSTLLACFDRKKAATYMTYERLEAKE
jgi:hypothetical protein